MKDVPIPEDALKDFCSITGAKMDMFMNLTENKPFTENQMVKIANGVRRGFSMEQMKLYAKPEFSPEKMNIMYLKLKEGLSIE